MTPFSHDDRGVAPVIGVVLMVAIVVMLGALTATLLTGFGDSLSEPQGPATFDTEFVADGDGPGQGAFVTLTYTGGYALDQDQVFVRDDAGNEVSWGDVWTTVDKPVVEPGDVVHIDGDGSDGALVPLCEAGQRYVIVVERSDGSTTIVDEFVVPTRPTDRTNCSP